MKARLPVYAGSLLAAGALTLAACGTSGGGSGGGSGSAGRQASQPTPAKSAAAAVVTPSSTTVRLGDTGIGAVLVSSDGSTLYRFDKDVGTQSTCYGACADAWPPDVITGGPTGPAGLGGALGVTTRTDGTTQVTYQGHPLYHFAGDRKPGDTNGDGLGGIWHVVRTTGPAANTTAAPTSPSAPSSSYGY